MKKKKHRHIVPEEIKEEEQELEKIDLEKHKPENAIVEEIKLARPINSQLIGNKVAIVEDFQLAQPFYDRSSFGEIHGVKEKRLELALEEALYLMERGKLKVFDGKKELKFDNFVRKANKLEKNFWTRYQIYRDIRTRGYITKTALKFGADFRVYPRGIKPGQDHAKWVLFATAEGDTYTWREFAAMNRVAHSTRKRLLVGIVDAEGEITYYEIRWKKP
ncbi:MAG: tRNA-intron lyase [Candidatus Nanoarchaeia archaeon]